MFRSFRLCLALLVIVTGANAQLTVNAKKRTIPITINGVPNETAWEFTNNVTKAIIGTPNNTTKFAVLWDSANLYIAGTITDAAKRNDSPNAWDDDAFEIYIDAEHNAGTTYGVNDRQFVKEWNSAAIWERTGKTTGVQHAWATTSTGYTVEILIPWTSIGITNPQTGLRIGFDVACDDDDDNGPRESQQLWNGTNDNWQWPSQFGDLVLVSSDIIAPSAPANVVASAITQSSLLLNWTASTDNVGVVGYDVYRNGVKQNTALITGTSYSVTGLTVNTSYQFYVRAADAAGNISTNSNTITVVTPDTQAPTAPANLAGSNVTHTAVTLTWSASTDNLGVAGYDVYRNGVKLNSANITVTSYSISGLTAATTYQFYVRARDAAGNNSANSNTISITTATTPDTQAPTAPTNVFVTSLTQNTLTLNWTASSDNVGVSGYEVFQNGVRINAAAITSTSYNVTGLNASSAYQFHVRARDLAGNISANSIPITATTPDTQHPTAPSNLVASNLLPTSVMITWNASTDNVGIVGYEIYLNGTRMNSNTLTVTNYTLTNLDPNTTYFITVSASDPAGNVAYSAQLVVLTPLPPDSEPPTAPGNLTASDLTQNSVTLSWTAATDNLGVWGYDVYQDNIKINTATVASLNYTVTGLGAATSYQFHVVARDVAGNTSINSNMVSITTPDTENPVAPTSVTAINISETTLTLNWNAGSDNVGITGYDVYQNNQRINSVPVNFLTYDVSGLTASTSYIYRIVALDAAGNSSTSNSFTFTTSLPPDTEAPTAPGNLAASSVSQTSLLLTWTVATDDRGVTGYDIYQNGVKINTVNITNTSYVVSGLSILNTYTFYVVAKDAAGNFSANSNVVTVTIADVQAPTAPLNLAAGNITGTSITLTWSASTDNDAVAGYEVYRNGVKINASAVTTNSFNVTGLSQATSYSFFVRAFDASGNVSANSNTISITTADTQAPSAPTNLVSSNLVYNAVTLSWSAATDNVGVAGYDVYRNGVKVNSTLLTTNTYTATALNASTAYSFYVRAIDAAGNNSGNSNTISITTPAAPGCTGLGAIAFQKWTNVTGTAVTNLTSLATYPNSPNSSGTLTLFEIPTNTGDNYGMRVNGYICPPTTGSYTFWIAGDDNCELWLSTTSSAASKQRIAYHTSWTNAREWNKFATQKSVAITLTAGQLYYVEALLKEGSQGDHMAVGWAKPGQATTTASEVIPGNRLLAQLPDAQPPTTPDGLTATAITTSTFTLLWNASTDNNAVAGYDIYRNGTKINSSIVSATAYAVNGLTPATSYSFTVIARDPSGNSSTASTALTVATLQTNSNTELFTQKTIIGNQRMPHDLVYGPDNNIWYTERFGGTVSFVNPATSVKTVVLTLGSSMVLRGGQDGLMGLALHPNFLNGKPYVYISYTYDFTGTNIRKTRIARYTYNFNTKKLETPVTVLDNIPGSNDHNSARLAIGPDLKLYYTVGDMGAGQFENQTRTNNAQNLNVLEGKVLRLNTETISGSWIPSDNPFSNAGAKTAVYSFGHRNPQGLVWGNVNGTSILYSSEHGPYSDDEMNIIESGRNYGWPLVAGFCDGNYTNRFVGGGYVGNERTNCVTLNAREPIRSLFPVLTPPDSTTSNLTWPSTAPSGTDFYGSSAIPGWQNSLLVAQLKKGTITRFKLSNDGLSFISDTIEYFRGKGRFRDVVVSADGLKIYVACDSSGSTSGPTGGVTSSPANPGSILEFTYQPSQGARQRAEELITLKQDAPNNMPVEKSTDIYPNPASNFIIVYNYSGENGRTIELLDMNGKTVKRQSAINLATRIDVSDIATGVYVIKITDSKARTVRSEKVVVAR